MPPANETEPPRFNCRTNPAATTIRNNASLTERDRGLVCVTQYMTIVSD